MDEQEPTREPEPEPAEAVEVAEATEPTEPAKPAGKPKKKRGPLGACLMGCVALVFVIVIALGGIALGVRFWLGEQFIDDLLLIWRSDNRGIPQDRTPPEEKPEPKEFAQRVVGSWTGKTAKGKDLTTQYGKDGELVVSVDVGLKQPPKLFTGTWKAIGTEGETLRVRRQFATPPPGEPKESEATITFPAANQMEQTQGNVTIRFWRD